MGDDEQSERLRDFTHLLGLYVQAVCEYVVLREKNLPRTHVVDRSSEIRTALVAMVRELIANGSPSGAPVPAVDLSRSTPNAV